jgi:hypothetical protein
MLPRQMLRNLLTVLTVNRRTKVIVIVAVMRRYYVQANGCEMLGNRRVHSILLLTVNGRTKFIVMVAAMRRCAQANGCGSNGMLRDTETVNGRTKVTVIVVAMLRCVQATVIVAAMLRCVQAIVIVVTMLRCVQANVIVVADGCGSNRMLGGTEIIVGLIHSHIGPANTVWVVLFCHLVKQKDVDWEG